ncbi:P-loop containing nucleoside triphosphate hydrolase protein [Chytridium lagenaria]|nr:P-loop containing nucleoside triphosphate hydrolase protein [Chytridium lagenaria]
MTVSAEPQVFHDFINLRLSVAFFSATYLLITGSLYLVSFLRWSKISSAGFIPLPTTIIERRRCTILSCRQRRPRSMDGPLSFLGPSLLAGAVLNVLLDVRDILSLETVHGLGCQELGCGSALKTPVSNPFLIDHLQKAVWIQSVSAMISVVAACAAAARAGHVADLARKPLGYKFKDEQTHEANASIISRLFFTWMNPLLDLGIQRPLTEEDYVESSTYRSNCHLCGTIRKAQLNVPILTLLETPNVENKTAKGWMYLLILFTCMGTKAVVDGQMYFFGRRVSIQVRSILVSEIYEKSLRRATGIVPPSVSTDKPAVETDAEDAEKKDEKKEEKKEEKSEEASVGKIVTLMSVDAERIREFMSYSQRQFVQDPIVTVLSVGGLIYVLGWSALVGLAVIFISGPASGFIGSWLNRVQDELMESTDKRVNIVNEMLNGIRIIKYFAWERFFEHKVQKARQAEIWNIIRLAMVYLAFGLVGYGSSLVVAFATFASYTVIFGKELTAATAFTGLLLLGVVADLMGMLPYEIMTILQAKVSVDRIRSFLNEPELERFGGMEGGGEGEGEPPAVGFVGARFRYFSGEAGKGEGEEREGESTDGESVSGETLRSGKGGNGAFMLKDVMVRFKVGGLNVVCGATGSGKSSICLALLGELKRISGHAYLNDPTQKPYLSTSHISPISVAYVAQTSWLLNATIRENILMGSEFDVETPTPTRFLDDPLSAVDAPTGRHLVANAILGPLTKGRTVILVTHAVSLVLPVADHVIVLSNGEVIAQGSAGEVAANPAVGEIDEKTLSREGDVKKDEKKKSVVAEAGRETKIVEKEEKAAGDGVERGWGYGGGGVGALRVAVLSNPVTAVLAVVGGEVPVLGVRVEGGGEKSAFYYAMMYGVFGIAIMTAHNLNIHDKLLKTILGAPLRFFEVTPIGRILNRFSKDVSAVDNDVMRSISWFTERNFAALSILIVIAYGAPAFLVAIPPIVFFFRQVAVRYLKTSRELKRLESVSRSPLYSQFSETLSGVATIRAYGQSGRFSKQSQEKVDSNHRAYYLLWASNRWLTIRTDFISASVVFFAGAAIFSAAHAEMEMAMNSVERCEEYSKIEQEPPAIVEGYRPPVDWPQQGQVEVLTSLFVTLKIGVVGRTGAGKSTLSLAFFRIIPFAGGSITIDGYDLGRLGLQDLRERLTIIPQDPVLFTGTIRSNLDPMGVHADAELWRVLRSTHVLDSLNASGSTGDLVALETSALAPRSVDDGASMVESQSGNGVEITLDSTVVENGSNFSQGQRQLICMARALLRQSKLVFLDEATASIDAATDARIQTTIREELKDATIFCIAHRLRTIVDYDRVLVLDHGEVVGMCEDTGEFEELVEIARGAAVANAARRGARGV